MTYTNKYTHYIIFICRLIKRLEFVKNIINFIIFYYVNYDSLLIIPLIINTYIIVFIINDNTNKVTY